MPGPAAVTCSTCGRATSADEAGPTGTPPWTWSTATDGDRPELLCEECTRAHARSIEAKLGRDWW